MSQYSRPEKVHNAYRGHQIPNLIQFKMWEYPKKKKKREKKNREIKSRKKKKREKKKREKKKREKKREKKKREEKDKRVLAYDFYSETDDSVNGHSCGAKEEFEIEPSPISCTDKDDININSSMVSE